MEITQAHVNKIHKLLDSGLSHGLGKPIEGHMCVEAAICFALDLPHGDDPLCVMQSLRRLKIRLNDSRWSSNKARAEGLRRLAIAQLGSLGAVDEKEFATRVARTEANAREAHKIADAAAAAAAYADADKILADFAENVVQILIEMKAPGCKWLEAA